MSRIPPSLLYLTIYNPTLKPLLSDSNNEDAEEQAHILFYTARQHAVSRDRMLRQVGLAKALVNFSEMFGAALPCESVHSQARRMVMFSPEPDFWMHACYEVAKTPRPQLAGNKDPSKEKAKGKEKDTEQTTVLYDYHDSSVHDIPLRTYFQSGYEEFKLLHGSFKSVLAQSGQHALELQLERFFTVWAWKWDIEEDFGTHLGLPLHPLHGKLTPILDKFISALPDELMTFALMPPYLIPPRSPRYPPALVRYILSRLPPPAPNPPNPFSSPSPPAVSNKIPKSTPSSETKSASQAFPLPLSMPAMTIPSMNFGLDMKNVKWGWLTFGKGGTTKPVASANGSPNTATPPSLSAVTHSSTDSNTLAHEELQSTQPGMDALDVESLLEAMTTESVGSHTRAASPAPSTVSHSTQSGEATTQDGVGTTDNVYSLSKLPEGRPPPADTIIRPTPSFLAATIHTGTADDPQTTQKKRALHLSQGDTTIVIVVDVDHTLELSHLADEVVLLIDNLQAVVAEESRARDQQIPSVVKILQPKDTYIISMDELSVTSSAGFVSGSEHLHNGQALLRSGLDIQEVFSRGQNPQHWHVGKRGLGMTSDSRAIDGEVFMEVARKETTLTDVENELVSVVKKFAEQL